LGIRLIFVYLHCRVVATIKNIISKSLYDKDYDPLIRAFLIMIKKQIVDGKLTCASCDKKLETSFFYKNKKLTSGFYSYCKNCCILKNVKIRINHIGVNNLHKEEWRPVISYEGIYAVSCLGRVKFLDKIKVMPNGLLHINKKEKLRALKTTRLGYVSVSLYNRSNKKMKDHFVHRLVSQAFIPNPENKPFINHKDGNKQNNRVDNLEWCTSSENVVHAIENGLLVVRKGSELYNAKLTEEKVMVIKRFYRRFPKTKQRDFAKRINLCHKQLSAILKNKTWKHVVIS